MTASMASKGLQTADELKAWHHGAAQGGREGCDQSDVDADRIRVIQDSGDVVAAGDE